jgi:hypothetical protein
MACGWPPARTAQHERAAHAPLWAPGSRARVTCLWPRACASIARLRTYASRRSHGLTRPQAQPNTVCVCVFVGRYAVGGRGVPGLRGGALGQRGICGRGQVWVRGGLHNREHLHKRAVAHAGKA